MDHSIRLRMPEDDHFDEAEAQELETPSPLPLWGLLVPASNRVGDVRTQLKQDERHEVTHISTRPYPR
ncbi:hypothetical protein UFOVP580_44 [uncultured Caudovirales phage]|uniref:Uncharacterized protein n=1 Tax=uncultured Caudovirales phage TaxID=2100421 RepID=A0A6J5PH01_9CAUD|nr:hypothetical protein UFOVP580_44 [uncultured Caudovirales phage]